MIAARVPWAPLTTGGLRGADVPAALTWSSPAPLAIAGEVAAATDVAGGLRVVGNTNVLSPLAGTVVTDRRVVSSTA